MGTTGIVAGQLVAVLRGPLFGQPFHTIVVGDIVHEPVMRRAQMGPPVSERLRCGRTIAVPAQRLIDGSSTP
jgi:hypothetical protein